MTDLLEELEYPTAKARETGIASMTSKELLERLQRHYIKPGEQWAGGVFVPECGMNGATGSRADALYVGFTSTSGRLLVGHELKVSRADWRRELDQSGKADFWADNCHQWIIVAPGPQVVPAEEVPHGWGLMYPSTRTKTRMQIVIKPVTHQDRTPSWTAVRSIMSRLDTLRVQEQGRVRVKALEDARKRAKEELEARQRPSDPMTAEERQRLATLDQIEAFLGRKVERYAWKDNGESVGADRAAAALRLLAAADAMGLETSGYADEALRRQIKDVTKGLNAFAEMRDAFLALGKPSK